MEHREKNESIGTLGPPARWHFANFFGWRFGSPTKIGHRKKVGTLILTSLLEDLVSSP